MQSPSVASVAANIEAVGPPTGLRVPDLLRVGALIVYVQGPCLSGGFASLHLGNPAG